MENLDNSSKITTEYVMCSVHSSKLAKKYCSQCQSFICNACAIDNHTDHLPKVIKLNSLYHNNKDLLNKYLNLAIGNSEQFKQTSVSFKCMNFVFHEAKNFCKNCKKFICIKCSGIHFDGTHDIISISEYFPLIKDKIEFFLELMSSFENWQKYFSHSKIIFNYNTQRQFLENQIFDKIFEKVYKIKGRLDDLLIKRKNVLLSFYDELNKFFVNKNNLLAKNKKKFEEMENLFKMIKFDKDLIKVYEKFFEFENLIDSMLTEKERVTFNVLIKNIKNLEQIVGKYGEDLMNSLNESLSRVFDEEFLVKIDRSLNENQSGFEKEIQDSLQIDSSVLQKMIENKVKNSHYFKEDDLKIASESSINSNSDSNQQQESQKSDNINNNTPDKAKLSKEILLKNTYTNLQSNSVENLNLLGNLSPKERIIEIVKEKEIIKPNVFSDIVIENHSYFSILIVNKVVESENKITQNISENEKIPASSIEPPVITSAVVPEDKFSYNEPSSSAKEDKSKELEVNSGITEEVINDAFSSNGSESKNYSEDMVIAKTKEELNSGKTSEKRNTLDSEISKININIDESNENSISININSKESEVITLINPEKAQIEAHVEEAKPQKQMDFVKSYDKLTLSEKIELAKRRVEEIREDLNSHEDYLEINQEGVEVDKKKLTENVINQLLDQIFKWEERNQLELMSIGHNIKTIFIYNPIVDRIKEIEFTHKFPTFHSYLNILPWVYISGGKDFETNQENNNFFKIRRDSEKSFELVNLSPMQSKRSSHVMIYHSKMNSIYSISGSRNFSCERYDIQNDQWTMLPNLNSSREKASACIFSGAEQFLYVFSGFDRTINKCINTVERLNLDKSGSKWEVIQIKGIQNLLKRQALSCLYINNSDRDYSNQENNLLSDPNQIYLIGGINLLKNETKDVLLFNLKTNTIANHPKMVMNDNFAFNHSQFVSIPSYDPDLFFNFSDNFSVVVLDSKMKNFKSRKLEFI